MIDYFKNRYVPKDLSTEWKDEDGNVLWYNPREKKAKKGRAGDFFHEKITGLAEDELDYAETASKALEATFFFRSASSDKLKGEDPRVRSGILYSYMCTPSYQIYSEGLDGSMEILKGDESVRSGIRSGKYISRLLQIINSGELSLMDLECAYVDVDGDLLLSSSPINIINPYLGDNLTGNYVNLNPFILKGAFFIMPSSPYKAIIIYDKSVYKLLTKGGEVRLSREDTDIINMIGLYNGGADCGVICPNDLGYDEEEIEYVDSLMKRMSGKPRGKERYSRLDTYPFSTELSIFRFYADAVKNREKNIASPVRKLTSELEKYDMKNMQKITVANYGRKMHERYLFAESLIPR